MFLYQKVWRFVRTRQARRFILIVSLLIYISLGFASFFEFVTETSDFFRKALLFDYRIYEQAIHQVTQGAMPYTETPKIGWDFIYPPPSIIFIYPLIRALHALPLSIKAGIVWAINIMSMIGLVATIMHLHQRSWKESWWWYVLALYSFPFLQTLFVGQVNMLLAWGATILWITHLPASVRALGWIIAGWLKISPFVFLVPILSKRDYQVMLWAIGLSMFFILVTIGLWGIDIWRAYLNILPELWGFTKLVTESFVSKIYYALPYGPPRIWFRSHPEFTRSIQQGYTFYLLGIIVLSNILARYYNLPGNENVLITFLAFPLLPHIIWSHHFTYLLPPLMFWWAQKPSSLRTASIFVITFFLQINQYSLVAGLPWSRLGLGIHLSINILILSLLTAQIRQIFTLKPKSPSHK